MSDGSPIIVLNLPQQKKYLVIYATKVVAGFTGNASFANPNPDLAAVKARIGLLMTAEAAPAGSGTGKNRNLLRTQVKRDLNHLRDYAQTVIETMVDTTAALAMIESIAMRARKFTKPSKADLAAKPGSVSGEVGLIAKAVRGRAVYYWQFSLDQKEWTSVADTIEARTTIADLKPGVMYYFRVRSLSRRFGQSDFSQVVSLMVV